MRIFIDIGHPHEVHFYKNFIREMSEEGHEFLITARDRGFLFDLLKKENINYISRGKGAGSLIGKLFLLLKNDIFLYKTAKKFNPDILIGFGSFYIAQISWLLRKPGLLFNDTEHSWIVQRLYIPFCKAIITPKSYLKKHGRKHLLFKGYKELAYLNEPLAKSNIKEKLGIDSNQDYVVLRFISKNAFHDIFYRGFNKLEKQKLVDKLKERVKVFISSEGELPEELKPYELPTDPDLIHDVLGSATLFIGEGATMASETAMLGVPAIYNYMRFGYLQELEKASLLKYSNKVDEILEYAVKIIDDTDAARNHRNKVKELKEACLDTTLFMKWLVTNYPNSIKTLKENPDYQYNFKNKLS